MKIRKELLVPILLLALIFLFKCLSELRGSWEGDTDELMYHATRILHGELPWTREFNNKLPLTHFIFIVPALMRSPRIWQLFSIFSVLASAVLVFFSLKNMLTSTWGADRRRAGLISSYATALYIYLYAFLATSINSINPFSASFFMAGLLLEMNLFRGTGKETGLRLSLRSVAASLLVAIAVSMRPYFFMPSLLIGIWRALRLKTLSGGGNLFRIVLYMFQWSALIAGFGILLNYLPYLLTGNTKAFVSGLSLLGEKLVPSSIFEWTKRQFYDIISLGNIAFIAISASAILGICWFAGPARRFFASTREQSIDVMFCSALMPALIQAPFAVKHYYPHYLQFFIPFVVLSSAIVTLFLANRFDHIRVGDKSTGRFLWALAMFLLLFSVRIELVSSVAGALYPPVDIRIAEYLTIRSSGYADRIRADGFLYPESMYMHWKTDESRRGFTDSYCTSAILDGAWRHINMPKYLSLPKTKEEYCKRLITYGPRFVMAHSD